MDALEEYVKHELALREAVMRCECQIRQPSLGAEDIKEISDHMHTLRAQLEQKSDTLNALGKMRSAWMLEVRELKNQQQASNSTSSADAQIAELTRDLADARRAVDDKQRALEEVQRSHETAFAQERVQFEETNAATIEHWASIVATVEEERLAEQNALEALKAQLQGADDGVSSEQRMREAEDALVAERACFVEKAHAWAEERQMFVEQTRCLEELREEKAQMAQTLADERQHLTEEIRTWERRHQEWDDEKKTWEREQMDVVVKASARAATELAAREVELRAELEEEKEREVEWQRRQWVTSLERQREEWDIALRAAEERVAAVEAKRLADDNTREALKVRLRASEESAEAVAEERLVERNALATSKAHIQVAEERLATVGQVLADERQAFAAQHDKWERVGASVQNELVEEYERKMHQLEQVLAEERQTFAARRDEWERAESRAATTEGVRAEEWRQKVEEMEMARATERQSFTQERAQWESGLSALEEQYKGESRQIFALLAKEKQKHAAERDEWTAKIAPVEELLASERARAGTLEDALNAQTESLRVAEDKIRDTAADHTVPTTDWDGRGTQALEQTNAELAQALEQKDAELAAALAQKDVEWQDIIADFQNVLTRERAAQEGVLAQKDEEWQAIVNDFQKLLQDARAEAGAMQHVIDARMVEAAATKEELAELRVRLDARTEDAARDSAEGYRRTEEEWARRVTAGQEEDAAAWKEKEEEWVRRVKPLQEEHAAVLKDKEEEWARRVTAGQEEDAAAWKEKEEEWVRRVKTLQEVHAAVLKEKEEEAAAWKEKEEEWVRRVKTLREEHAAVLKEKEEEWVRRVKTLQEEHAAVLKEKEEEWARRVTAGQEEDAAAWKEKEEEWTRRMNELHGYIETSKVQELEWEQQMTELKEGYAEAYKKKEEELSRWVVELQEGRVDAYAKKENDWAQQVTALQAQIEASKVKEEELQQQVTELQGPGEKADAWQHQGQELQDAVAAHKAREGEWMRQVEHSDALRREDIAAQEEKYWALEGKYSTMEGKYNAATEELQSAHAAAVDLRAAKERQWQQPHSVGDGGELVTLRSQNRNLAAETAELRTKILYLQQQNMAERTKSAATLIEMETLKESMLRSTADEYEDKLEALEQQCDRLSAHIVELEQQRNVTVNETNAQLLTKLSRMESELSEAHKSKETAWREREVALIAQIDDARMKSEGTAAAESQVVADLRARAVALHTELEKVKQELAEQRVRAQASEERRTTEHDMGLLRSMSALTGIGPVSSYVGSEVGDGEERSVVSMQDVVDLRCELQQASMKALQIPDFQRTLTAERLAFKKKKQEMEDKIHKVIQARKADQQAMMKCNKEWQRRVQVVEEDRKRLTGELRALQSSYNIPHSAASSTSGKLAEHALEQRMPPLAAPTQSTQSIGPQQHASPLMVHKQPSTASQPSLSHEIGLCSASDSSKFGERNSTCGSQPGTQQRDSVGVQEQIDLLRQQRLQQLQKLEMLKRQQQPRLSSASSAASGKSAAPSVKSVKSAASVGSV